MRRGTLAGRTLGLGLGLGLGLLLAVGVLGSGGLRGSGGTLGLDGEVVSGSSSGMGELGVSQTGGGAQTRVVRLVQGWNLTGFTAPAAPAARVAGRWGGRCGACTRSTGRGNRSRV